MVAILSSWALPDHLSFQLYFPALLLLLPLLRALYVCIQDRLYTDLSSIPTPPLPFWKTVTTGHNLVHLMLREDSYRAADQFSRWRADYGPMFKLRALFGRPVIIATSDTAIRSILVTNQRRYFKTKAFRDTTGTLVGENGILLAEGDAHATLRKAVAPALHHDALVTLGHVFLREGALLAERVLTTQATGKPDLLRDVRIGTFKVIIETSFGPDGVAPDVAAKLQEDYLVAMVEPPNFRVRRTVLQSIFTFIPKQVFGWKENLKKDIRANIFELCSALRAAPPTAVHTPLMSLMVDEETNSSIGTDQLVDTILSFLLAGQITTSVSVCWALYLLAKEPSWQKRVQDELRECWSEEAGLDALDRLPLLSRVVRECLRLYPPLCYPQRALSEADELDGYKLPTNVNVIIPIFSLQRDESIWGADAGEFNPDRFLVDGELVRTKMFWLPFLLGPRNCLGQRFALLEIKAFLAQVLTRHNVYIRPLEDPPPPCRGSFCTPVGMRVYFEERIGSQIKTVS